MRYVSYTRAVSWCPVEDDDERTIAVQNEHIAEFAKEHNFRITKKYSDRTDSADAHKGFDSLMEDGVNRKFDCLVVDSIYRCGRSNSEVKRRIIDTLYLAGIQIIVVEDKFISKEKDLDHMKRYWNTVAVNTEQKKNPKIVAKNKKTPNPFVSKIFYAPTNEPLYLRTYKLEQYFLPRNTSVEKYPKVTYFSMQEMFVEIMNKEAEESAKIQEFIAKGNADEYIEMKLKPLREEITSLFERVANRELTLIDVERQYHLGEITEEEFRYVRKKYSEDLYKTEKDFNALTDKATNIKKIINVRNPWLLMMNKWEEKDIFTNSDIRIFVDKIYLHEDGKIQVILREGMWKRALIERMKELKDYGKEE